jgi:FG-GAP-like repeat/ASPIC and UnbV
LSPTHDRTRGTGRTGRVLGPVALLALTTLVPPARAEEPARSGRTVNWAKAREMTSRYREIVDLSGLVEVGAEVPTSASPEDLQALCAARREGIVIARSKAEKSLRELQDWQDPVSDEQRAGLERRLAAIAVFADDIGAAVQHLQIARDALARHVTEYPDMAPRFMAMEEALGVAHLRQAELDNCMTTMNTDRCLFPVRPGGQHQKKSGGEAALARFQAYLASSPKDLEVRWLFNLAHMLLGRYPQGVPKEQLLAPSLFQSETRMPRFVDVAARIGVGRSDIAGGTIADDMDGDGLPDIVFSSVEYCSPLRFYHNRGDGTFEDRSEAAGLLGELGGLNAVQTDYNNDGWLDIFVMHGGWEMPMRNALLRNNGDGTFTDVTKAAGLQSAAHATHSAAWADYDNDGWLDVFVGHELTPSQLFRNRGDGTFEDATARAGVGATAFTKGVTWGDYDKDGYPDLYVSNIHGDNFLYHNNGDGTFTDLAAKLSVQKPFVSFPTWFFDYDNDGWLDIFVASYPTSIEEFVKHYLGVKTDAETLTLYRNRGDGTFENVSEKTGLARAVPAMGVNFGDLDNDGFLDMYLGTGTPSLAALMPNIMLKNDAGRRFLDVTEATGTGHLQKGHGIAFTDLDNDGDADVILNVGGAVPGDHYDDVVFENPGGYGNNWISIKLVGVKTNRVAIGAKLTLRLHGAGEGSQLRYREVTSGGSFGSSSLTQLVGLGKAKVVDALEIEWPVSRTKQVFFNVPVNTFIEIRELSEAYTTRTPPRFALGPHSSVAQKQD